MNKTINRIAIVFLILFFSALSYAAVRKGPYLLFEGSNTAMTVLWQTSAVETNTLSWGTDTNYSMGQASVGTYGTDYQHKYVITGLQPGAVYYYQVSSGYGSGSFRTAPASDAVAVKLLAYGDTRSDPTAQGTVAGRMRAAYAADPAFQTICLNAGDWVASNGETYWTSEWFVNTNTQLHAFQAEVPIVGARGNHEGTGTVYSKYFPEPYTGGFYWSFDYGPAHVAVVDQYTSYTAGSAQLTWLTNDLAATSKPWKIVVLHEPGWTSGGSHGNNTTVQTVLQPLFKQYGVQMVVGGHNHYYARGVVENIQHLTLGGGGAPLYAPAAGQPNIVTIDQSYHHTELDIDGNTMLFTARRSDGSVIESITLYSTNQTPSANAGADRTVSDSDGSGAETVTLDGSSSNDVDGTISSYVWTEGAAQIATGVTPAVSFSVGVHNVTLTVTDNMGATATDTAVITVSANQSPTANAGADQIVNDSDNNGAETVTLNGTSSSDPDGVISSYIWMEGETQIATGIAPSVSFAAGVHTLTLIVTDNGGAASTDTVQVTVVPCYAVNTRLPGVCYPDIGAAYQAADDGDTIKAVNLTFAEALNADRPIGVTFLGGYDPSYSAVAGASSIQLLNVQRGAVTVSNLVITP